MSQKSSLLLSLCLSVVINLVVVIDISAAPIKHIVLIAAAKGHDPGEHEYLKSIKLLKVLLDRAPNLKGVRTEVYFNGWPDDPTALERADTIAILSDGIRAPSMTDQRMKELEKQMRRGCGFMTFHYSTFTLDKYAPQVLDWNGGYFDWQHGHGEGGHFGDKSVAFYDQYHSLVREIEADVQLGTPLHPILEGVSPFRLKDEFYYQLVFRDNEPRVTPIIRVPELAANPEDQIVAWALSRADGGRGFGTTSGHYFSNWQNDNYRKMILNALVWTAGMAVPPGGVTSSYANDDEVDRALMTKPIHTLLAPGDTDAVQDWKKRAGAIVAALNSEVPRFDVDVTEDTKSLGTDLSRYKLVILANCDGLQSGLESDAKERFSRYIKAGGAITILYSPREESERTVDQRRTSDRPEFDPICKHVALRPAQPIAKDLMSVIFSVTISDRSHPASKDVPDWEEYRVETTDDLNFSLLSSGPIHTIARVQSRGTGRSTPLAFTSLYSKARIFHLVVGSDVKSIVDPRMAQLIRYGSLWAAGD